MVKKSQLKKYTVQKILELSEHEIDGETLKIFKESIDEKNEILLEKKKSLEEEL